MIKYIFIWFLLQLVNAQYTSDICSNVLKNEENKITLDDALLDVINENEYTYQDIINCLDDNGIFDIQIDIFEPESNIEINKGIMITSTGGGNDKKNVQITCPNNDTLFIIKLKEEVTFENLTIEGCQSNNNLIEITNENSEELVNEYSTVQFINLKFKHNVVSRILKINKMCWLNIENNEFINNTGTSSLIEINNATDINITKSYFRDNFIMSSGAILRSDMVENVEINIINENYFINNTANNTQGGAIWLRGNNMTLNIEESYFLKNKAVNEGGAIAVHEGVFLSITDSTFMENESMERGGGGAIYAEGHEVETNVEIKRSNFSLNKAKNFFSVGGSLRINGIKLKCNISDGTIFTYNIADMEGGAFYIGDMAIANINSSIFDKNLAYGAGGALSIKGYMPNGYSSNKVSLYNCTFSENVAVSYKGGGAIYGGELGTNIYVYGGKYVKNRCIQGSGGVFRLFSGPFIEIEEVYEISNNYGIWAGMMFAENEVTVIIKNTTVENNTAAYPGGAIYATGDVDITLTQCEFSNNKGKYGAAIRAKNYHDSGDEETKLTFSDTVFYNNNACYDDETKEYTDPECFAGAVSIEGGGVSGIFENCSFIENKSPIGGAIRAYWPKYLTIKNSTFEHNIGKMGGAMHITMYNPDYQQFSVKIENVIFTNNSAESGGALYLTCETETSTQFKVSDFVNVTFSENKAENQGGVIHAKSVYFTAKNCYFINNRQTGENNGNSSIRSVISMNEGSIFEAENSFFHDNKSNGNGGVINAFNSYLNIEKSRFANNTSSNGNGGSISHVMTKSIKLLDMKYFKCIDCVFENSTANKNGGAIYMRNEIEIEDDKYALLQNVMFKGNSGSNGGAIFVNKPKNIKICCNCNESEITSNLIEIITLPDLQESCKDYFINNSHSGIAGYGDNYASIPYEVISSLENNQIFGISSDKYLEEISFRFEDAFGQNVISTEMVVKLSEVEAKDFTVAGQKEAGLNETGFSVFSVTKVTAPYREEPYIIHVLFLMEENEIIPSYPIKLYIRPCNIGEILINSSLSICKECDVNHYNFNPNGSECKICPLNTECLNNGATLTPLNGFWHMTSFSTDIYHCSLIDACNVPDRITKLSNAAYERAMSNDSIKYYNYTDPNYNQCSDGYKGRVCGTCDMNYAKTGNSCQKCPQKKVYSLICIILQYTITIGVMIYFIKNVLDLVNRVEFNKKLKNNELTVFSIDLSSVSTQFKEHHDIESNKEMKNKLSGSSFQTSAEIHEESSEQDIKDHVSRKKMLLRSFSYFQMKLDKSKNKQNMETMLVTQDEIKPFPLCNPVAEILKILINYLQVTSTGIIINVSWTNTLKQTFIVQDILSSYTVATGSAYFSFDCILNIQYKHRFILSVLVNIFTPVLYFAIISIFWLIYIKVKNMPLEILKNRVLLTFLSILYISYAGITRNLLRFYECIPFKDNTNHYTKFWAEESETPCYKEAHLVAIIGTVPLLVMYVLGFPAFVVYKLKKNSDKLEDGDFISNYGFLYKSYVPHLNYWEAVIMARKAFIASIVVFSYDLGGNLQGILVCTILFTALVLQLYFMPFTSEYPKLNYFEICSLISTSIVFVSGLILNDASVNDSSSINENFRIFVSVIMVLLVICTILIMITGMFMSAEDFFNIKLLEKNLVNFSEIQNMNFNAKLLKLSSYYTSSIKDCVFKSNAVFKKA